MRMAVPVLSLALLAGCAPAEAREPFDLLVDCASAVRHDLPAADDAKLMLAVQGKCAPQVQAAGEKFTRDLRKDKGIVLSNEDRREDEARLVQLAIHASSSKSRSVMSF